MVRLPQNVGGTIALCVFVPTLHKNREQAEHQYSSLSVYWLWMPRDQCLTLQRPHLPHHGLHPQTVSQAKSWGIVIGYYHHHKSSDYCSGSRSWAEAWRKDVLRDLGRGIEQGQHQRQGHWSEANKSRHGWGHSKGQRCENGPSSSHHQRTRHSYKLTLWWPNGKSRGTVRRRRGRQHLRG